MKKLSFLMLLSLLMTGTVIAQELRCNISVSGQQIQGANRNVFQTMQADLYEFMNNRKWTDHVYSMDERIECSIYIRLTEQISSNEFKGSIQVQLRRPVFNSDYETPLLNIKDNDFHVEYVEYQAMEFNETSNRDNLTNLMAFYAYIILGMDYDSFSPNGGTPYFQKAQQIVNNSQNVRYSGWKAYESERNRYWLIENIMNRSYAPFRDCIYQYHRLGLDQMNEQIEEGRAAIAESLKSIQKVFRSRPSLYILQVFFDAKSDELVNVFSKSYPDERNRVLTILNEVDPSNGSKYEKINEAAEEF
ncbi:type IX secretion system protein PorD [Sunxiuqinia sp. sy24]|uniref:type IX secretion system protein PorD n=1 Tax=Sunxiuqinia sp. sy24 TaxID=3461495 RepID=UPI004045CA32